MSNSQQKLNRDEILQKFAALSERLADAHFEAGNWRKDESEEAYETLHDECVQARAALDAFVSNLL